MDDFKIVTAMYRRIGLFLLLCGFLLSCKESEKERISRLVSEWDGKEIVFPSAPVFTVQGRDTVSCPSGTSPYKVLTYIDSVGCTSCKLQLPRWKELMSEVDSVTEGKTAFLFYFHPKNVDELRHIFRRDAFSYPVCLDLTDGLNRRNRFPGEMAFQTFLLDADNRVVAIGNPVHNPEVKRLYLRILSGVEDVSQNRPASTTVSMETSEVDFGRFSHAEEQVRTVVLRNTGARPLAIHGIDTSCGCTRVEYDKRPVCAGSETTLRIVYKAEEKGHFRKIVDVYCNTPGSPLRIVVTGDAV